MLWSPEQQRRLLTPWVTELSTDLTAMPARRSISISFVATLTLLLFLGNQGVVFSQQVEYDHPKLTSTLRAQLEASVTAVPVYAMLHEQANGRLAAQQLAARGASKRARTEAAVRTIKEQNTQTQAPLVEQLRRMEGVEEVRGFWLVNMIAFTATPDAILRIAELDQVAGVFYDAPWEPESIASSAVAAAEPDGAEPGHRDIRAHELRAMGYTGFGGVAFTADTGVDPFHPALNFKYAAYDGRPTSWYDINPSLTTPFDCGDHGTHVTGTILGLDRGTNDTIGVAPNAHWIGAGILCGVGTSDNIGAFQWALDPDGDPSTDADRPTVINNSWRDPQISDFECSASNPYPIALDNLMAAGIAVVFSAGNDGPEPGTITPPHNYNAGLVNAFTVGALSNRQIASFSSRGPALCPRDSMPLDIKPEVSAPGVSVRSCLPGSGYGLKSGTSMASPHVAGAILLLHEAFPDLTGEELQLALYWSATDLGPAGEDNTFGRGIIDVKAAYDRLVSEGNVPTPPVYPAKALNLSALTASSRQCGGEVNASFAVRNDGTEAIQQFEYALYHGDDEVIRLTHEAEVVAGASVELPLNFTTDLVGEQVFTMRLLSVDGAAPHPALDNGGALRLEISTNDPATLLRSGDDASICNGSVVVLDFAGTLPYDLVPYFSSNPEASVGRVGQPAPFVLGPITETTTLYGQAEYLVLDGPSAPGNPALLQLHEGEDFSLRFEAIADGRLRYVDVYSAEEQRIRFTIENMTQGTRAGRVSERVEQGLVRLEVGANLEAGDQYEVIFTDGVLGEQPDAEIRGDVFADLVRILQVDGPTAADRRSSYFFFDWEFGITDGCPLQEIVLSPDTARTASQLVVSAVDSVIEQYQTLQLSELTGQAQTDFTWFVNDTSLVSTSPSLNVVVASTGEYDAHLSALDAEGCLSYGTTPYTVTPSTSNLDRVTSDQSFSVFPNPATTGVMLSRQLEGATSYALFDALGRKVAEHAADTREFRFGQQSPGTYTLEVRFADGTRTTSPLTVR